MNALRPLRPPLQPVRAPRSRSRANPYPHGQSNRTVAFEVAAKLAVNLAFSAVAVITLVKIMPYQLSQQEKLQEVRSEVSLAGGRVDRLNAEFSRYFDSKQTRSAMQEKRLWVDSQQKPVVWVDKNKSPIISEP